MTDFDVLVVGSGHAGCEAALAAARMGCRTAVITLNLQRTAHMPCNCSIGGPAKGHLVREIDALGGQMGMNIDRTLTHIRFVGTGKGPAVRTLRAHADKAHYPAEMLRTLQQQENLTLLEGAAEAVLVRDGVCYGIRTRDGELTARAVILTTGTFLNGLCHIGEQQNPRGALRRRTCRRADRVAAPTGVPHRALQDGHDPAHRQNER
jgi:tRNA uridine 5-carboxymethylaminomethyl modification enzyme